MRAMLVLIAAFCVLTFAAAGHIHFGSTNNPLNGLTITWHSTNTNDSIRWGYTSGFEQGGFASANHASYSTGYWHDYAFPVLTASSTIRFSIYDGAWSEEKTFATSTDTSTTQYSFIGGGDSRTNMTGWQQVANRLATEDAAFHLFTGDHVNDGSLDSNWDAWYDSGKVFLEKNLIYHTGGNHEYGANYLNQFIMPGNEQWYAFEFGNALFICLLSESSFAEQYPWLLQQLQNTDKTWKIVFFHKPFFVTAAHQHDMDAYRGTWWKAFDDYGVDVVLNGHVHYYMRSRPINLNVSANAPVDEYGSLPGQGRLEVVSGCYGVGAYNGVPTYFYSTGTIDDWFVEKGAGAGTQNYAKFSINGTFLHMDAYDVNGILLDSLSINKLHGGTDVLRPYSIGEGALQASPNPFNANITISLDKGMHYGNIPADIFIYNTQGKNIWTATIALHVLKRGVSWDAGKNSSGVYLIRLKGQGFELEKKIVLQK
ncbi:MAG: hypothetical protein A2268_13590 [Candidatus Raymondbacteria bacterium RifOxyA12_full_50_37]|uniref:Calcineurin-like phosphoesterase domain-containing protein n=1 Tax=Candidatus Raymondbacteria bacterium RIFOXYD12_FULL_49_13 TaxID=1817890 RepID=A0A1F7F8N9_UNCRA|nr:MAG: hypothetical protein A2268_13590 [Candidatus Raymondbacteria bacterium RifOxyA12_full_50_37]OGJ91498.1 MAG: hypothetical protein A2248_03605 [Candidatus Raymondbacteria bacterium RIFOXYA2_FULL_49_16]OGJ97812.1 MAG: hypothetical protein A2453_13990 [Candidatus Raymondbacteria bacterium RIFOXYC2_FULL_50_21]OGK01977.1 MAG: hypothetical protein A2487_11080 [Candidatus Raymondbacteria bacterium RifOxyC12_full_50_8]OGK02993.1 MAG: hypothetical protein A2519_06515 [Candidatus Raymondbacteria b